MERACKRTYRQTEGRNSGLTDERTVPLIEISPLVISGEELGNIMWERNDILKNNSCSIIEPTPRKFHISKEVRKEISSLCRTHYGLRGKRVDMNDDLYWLWHSKEGSFFSRSTFFIRQGRRRERVASVFFFFLFASGQMESISILYSFKKSLIALKSQDFNDIKKEEEG